MKKILIVTAKRTEWLSNLINQSLVEANFSLNVALYKEVKVVIKAQDWSILINNKKLEEYDLVIFRFERHSNGLANVLSLYLESKGKYYRNKYLSKVYFGNKLIQNTQFFLNNINIPTTIYLDTSNILAESQILEQELGYPYIMKDIDGTKGKNNYLVKSLDHLKEIVQLTDEKTKFIFQKFIPNYSDYRVVVYDQSYVGSIDQRSRKNTIEEHRNNASLGGTETFYDPLGFNEELKEISIAAAKATNIDTAGVDVILSDEDNKFYVIEVNSSPGITLNTIEHKGFLKYLNSIN